MSGVSAMLALLHVGRIGFGRRGNAHLRIDRLGNVNRSAPMPNLENLRKQAKLNLRCVEQPVIDAGVRDREQLLSASLTVATAEEIKALFLEFQNAGVTVFQTLKSEPWGARNFILKDLDGNLLLFAGPAE